MKLVKMEWNCYNWNVIVTIGMKSCHNWNEISSQLECNHWNWNAIVTIGMKSPIEEEYEVIWIGIIFQLK